MHISRRQFIKGAGGFLLPVAAGIPLMARSEFNPDLPKSGNFTAENQGGYSEISIFYFLEPSDEKPPHGSLSLGQVWVDQNCANVEYKTVHARGATVFMSSPSPSFSGANVPNNCREVELTVTEFSSEADILSSGIGKATLRLQDGTIYKLVDSSFQLPIGCFLTTACTAARGLPDDCVELQTLRAFRDGYMKVQATNGAAMIREYYQTAPTLVSAINARDNAAEIHDWMYRDLVLPSVRFIQRGQNARALDHYAGFVADLSGLF